MVSADVEFQGGFPTEASARDAWDAVALRRAIDAYRFFYPAVSLEGIFRGTRGAGAKDNASALLFVARPHHVGFTLNSDTPYTGAILDLREAGPMVIDVPAGPLVGLVDDHYQRWVTDLGLSGRDAGAGGRHLITPPGWDGEVPDGYLHAASDTFVAFCALRVLPLHGDVDTAIKLLASTRIYPLAQADAPKPYTFTDFTDQPVDCSCLDWEDNLEFWHVLHAVIGSEPAIEQMRPMLGALAEIGIEAGRPFPTDAVTINLLTRAAELGCDEMLVSAFASRRPDRMAWPDRAWEWVGLRPENGAFAREGSLDLEAKDRWFAQAIVTSPAMFRRAEGQGSLYWLGHRDGAGRYLDGGRAYRLTVPLPVPARLFWSVTCYDAETRSEVVADQGRAALRSLFEDLGAEGADRVELYFGPAEPDGARGRWIQTVPGRGWFGYFRIYGPAEPAFDGSWKPGDFTPVG
jgi:hypothetical protein